MTRSRWLAACAAALLLGGGARAQSCLPGSYSECPISEAARAPYFNELTRIVFPAQTVIGPCSGPAIWVRLFDAVAKNCAPAVCQPEGKEVVVRASGAVPTHCTVAELLKLYRFYYQLGRYGTAQFMARRALQLDPGNAAAEAALNVASVAADAVARAKSPCGDAEDCEAPRATAPTCGASAKGCAGCSRAPAKQCGQGCCKACNARASCACGTKCSCASDEPCACGADCCCKKTTRQNVKFRYLRQGVLHVLPNPVPMMMCPPCAMCPGAAMMPPPLPHPMVPGLPGGPPCWAGTPGCATFPCPVARPEQLPMPRVAAPEPVPSTLPTATVEPTRARLKIRVCGKQILLSCPCLAARCDNITALADGRALLEGNVTVSFRMDHQPAKIYARSMIVDLEDGTYEVNPTRPQKQAVKPVRHDKPLLAPAGKKPGGCKLIPAGWEAIGKPCCPVPCIPMPARAPTELDLIQMQLDRP